MAKRTITLDLLAKNKTSKAFRDAGRDAQGLSKVMVGAGAAIAAGMAVAGAAIIKIGADTVESLKRIEVIGAQTVAVIKSTGGAAGVTAEQVRALADRLEGLTATEAEAIQEGANLLLTFRNIRNGAGANERVFDRATELMVDMARAMGTDAAGSAIQLGKALNDPIAGVTALTRMGVQFTREQRDLIKSLVESNDMFGAQRVILDELESQFGGSGAAYASTLAGQVDTLNHNMGALAEEMMLELMPALQEVMDWMNGEGLTILRGFADWFVEDGVPVLRDFIDTLAKMGENGTLVPNIVAGIGAITAAQIGLNAAMAANPVGLIISALIALGSWFYWLANNFDQAQNWMFDAADNTLIFLGTVARGFVSLTEGAINAIGSIINAIYEPMNTLLRLLNLPEIRFPQVRFDTSGITRVVNQSIGNVAARGGAAVGSGGGGAGFRAMAEGGIVRPTPGGTRAVIGEAGQAEAVIPLSASNLARYGLGGGVTVVMSDSFVGSPDELARKLDTVLSRARRRGTL